MIIKDILERQELLTSIIMEDTESTFDNLNELLSVCNPTNQELKDLLNDIRISNMIRNHLYENGVTK